MSELVYGTRVEIAPDDSKDATDSKVVTVEEKNVPVVDGETAEARRLFSYEYGEKLKRRADWHIMPVLVLAYLVKNIDVNMVSYVRTINVGTDHNILKALHMTSNEYSYLSTCFTVTFILSEIPSNFIIKWSTPRLHFVRIMIGWSIVCACHAACKNKESIYACRALLGLMEGGLWPGIQYQMTCWYRPDELAVRMAGLIALGLFSGVIDSVLSYGLSFISGKGMMGWQWAFVIPGIIGLFLAAWTYFNHPDWPDSPPSRRQFLTEQEGAFMVSRLPPNASKSTDSNFDWAAVKADLKTPLPWSFGLLMMLQGTGTTGLTFWLPTIIQGWGLTTLDKTVVYIIFTLTFAHFIDHNSKLPKPVYMLISLGIMIPVFVGMIFCESKGGRYALIILAYMCNAMYQTCIIPLRAQSTRGSSSAAFAYAFQNVFGNSVGLYSAQIFQSKYAPRYAVPFVVCIIFFAAAAIPVCSVWYFQRDIERETRELGVLRRKQGKKEGEVVDLEVKM
ncbi:hypothetical protein IAR55_005987 [Kwoniella newhampshirensis]|uniref:Major facilitator superfamily (MFS) profile domain-containing protein n=1 Tax=Kwoniella newhampshirensis TaxID=1651941 RepID=A0AAW0YJD5_9TREE